MEKWLRAKKLTNYEVSNTGLIRNVKTGRVIKTHVNDRGYVTACLRDNKKQVTVRVHRLVADTFYDGDHEGRDVNHIDGDKTNNHISNLEFCSRSENINHAFQTGLKRPSRRHRVRVVETGEIFESIRECARVLGCGQQDICSCLNGKQKTCAGYHFERV